MDNFEHFDRRTLLKEAGALALSAAVTGLSSAQAQGPEAGKFFPAGFKSFKFQTSGAMINGVIGGEGPPLLLLHGAPESHIAWRIVAPRLMNEYTVVVPDLRGYGDSSKPPDGRITPIIRSARWRSIMSK